MPKHSEGTTLVRTADPDDAPHILALAEEMGASGPVERLASQLQETRHRDDAEVFVAERNGLVVGFAYVHVIPTVIRDGSWARLASMAVHPDHRRAGIGQSLVAAAEQFARNAHAESIELTSAGHRTEAHEFYRAAGYGETATSLWFAKALDRIR